MVPVVVVYSPLEDAENAAGLPVYDGTTAVAVRCTQIQLKAADVLSCSAGGRNNGADDAAREGARNGSELLEELVPQWESTGGDLHAFVDLIEIFDRNCGVALLEEGVRMEADQAQIHIGLGHGDIDPRRNDEHLLDIGPWDVEERVWDETAGVRDGLEVLGLLLVRNGVKILLDGLLHEGFHDVGARDDHAPLMDAETRPENHERLIARGLRAGVLVNDC